MRLVFTPYPRAFRLTVAPPNYRLPALAIVETVVGPCHTRSLVTVRNRPSRRLQIACGAAAADSITVLSRGTPVKTIISRIAAFVLLPFFVVKDFDFRIALKKYPVLGGREYPWFTGPAIKALEALELDGLAILEFGGGYSSIYFSKRGAKVTVFERDAEWSAFIAKRAPSVMLVNDVSALSKGVEEYDIVVVDVFNRPDHFEIGARLMKRDGILILDDSQWYPNFLTTLRGFLPFHYWGTCSGRFDYKCTTFFVRNERLKSRFAQYGRGLTSKDDRPASAQ
jgi:hypothetical protein